MFHHSLRGFICSSEEYLTRVLWAPLLTVGEASGAAQHWPATMLAVVGPGANTDDLGEAATYNELGSTLLIYSLAAL